MRAATRALTAAMPAIVVGVVLATALPAAADRSPLTYQPPVEAPIVDGFRSPSQPWESGNRGLEYATAPGSPVQAAAGGEVAFAGAVAGARHVVVLHPDGLRSTYAFLAEVSVTRGQRIRAGQVVGTAASRFHFGVRAGDVYLDPLTLFEPPNRRAHLVPDRPDPGPRPEPEERGGLARWLGAIPKVAAAVGRGAVQWAAGERGIARPPGFGPVGPDAPRAVLDTFRIWARQVDAVSVQGWVWAGVEAVGDWTSQRDRCTPASAPPRPPPGRRIAVLVGGLGSQSRHASILDVDTTTLGYAPGDVVQFSYRGGTIDDHPYDQLDTQQPLPASSAELRALLDRLHETNPDAVIDVLAHSQGGLVARLALGEAAPAGVATLTTLGSPLAGADVATAADLVAGSAPGRHALRTGGEVARQAGAHLEPDRGSIQEMSEHSPTVLAIGALDPPPGVRMTSIAARGDLVVPSPRTRLAGFTSVVVAIPGLNDHTNLAGSAPATREIALALAGQPPTCRTLWSIGGAALVGHGLSVFEDTAGLAFAVPTTALGRAPFPAAW